MKVIAMSEDNLPIILPASFLNIDFPKPNEQMHQKDVEKIQNTIIKHGAYTIDGETLIDRKAIPVLLNTDQAGANKVVAETPDKEKIEDGDKILVRSSHLNKVISDRIQEPRDPYQHEILKYAEKSLNSFRDNPSLQNSRHVLEARNERDMPAVKRKVLAEAETCISGDPLEPNAEVHHKDRVADAPRRSIDPNNLVATNRETHREIHRAEAHGEDALEKMAEERGWPKKK